MPKNNELRVKISAQQKELIQNLCEAKGYRSVSDYVRSCVLGEELSIHAKLNRILEQLKNEDTIRKDPN